MNDPHVTNPQGKSGLMPLFGTVTAFVSLVGIGVVVGATATVMMMM